ncbi:hypothetical protein K439DRAFT_406480 [Ramaria rubella]|nr:hypothetical protein K439DRAFT_406480 [Ramaria rubella]
MQHPHAAMPVPLPRLLVPSVHPTSLAGLSCSMTGREAAINDLLASAWHSNDPDEKNAITIVSWDVYSVLSIWRNRDTATPCSEVIDTNEEGHEYTIHYKFEMGAPKLSFTASRTTPVCNPNPQRNTRHIKKKNPHSTLQLRFTP